MRSDKSTIDQLLMCMSKPQAGDLHPKSTSSTVKTEPFPISSSDTSRTSFDDNDIIEFGPIKVKPRKRPAPTLATGRRSKYEILTTEEEQKRNVRRARNRAAAERVRISRLAIEQQLQEQIDQLERDEQQLQTDVQNLQNQKLHLETRIYTHQQMCSNVQVSQIDLPSYFPLDAPNSTPTLQSYDKLPELDFDDAFFQSLNY